MDASRKATAPAPRGQADGRPIERILVVDDNEEAAELLARRLTRRGFEARIAHGGADALAVAAVFLPDAVFLDIGMPGMDGHEVARRLRADPAHAGVRLVALTGWTDDDSPGQAAAAGFDVHLTKPATPAMIEEALGPGAAVRR